MQHKHLYTGGYNENNDGGICHFRFCPERGTAELQRVETACKNPSFLAFHPNGTILYAANELEDMARITAHRIGEDGSLQYIGAAETTGSGMCHLHVNRAGTAVYGANYGSGNVVAFQLCGDGSIGVPLSNIRHKGSNTHLRQDRARVHQIVPDPEEQWLIAVDFGVNALFAYKPDAYGALREESCVKSRLPDGEGPRHLVFHPSGRTAYVITELGNKIYRMVYDGKSGSFSVIDAVALVGGEADASVTSAEIAFSPDNRYLFASVRGADKIVVFAVDEDTGALRFHTEFSSGGREPRMFSFDSSGEYLFAANQRSSSVAVMQLNSQSNNCFKECAQLPAANVSFAAIGPAD